MLKILKIEQNKLQSDKKILEEIIDDYLDILKEKLVGMEYEELKQFLVSESNYYSKGEDKSCIRNIGVIREGDICYIDFGKNYTSEIGFQHFGLVVKVFESKAFVIPMTSNEEAYEKAYDPIDNPTGTLHLMRLDYIKGLNKMSVLFLNDGRYINTARIIKRTAKISTYSDLYMEIKKRIIVHVV